MLPYSRQYLDEDDIQAVIDVLRSDWITTGPMLDSFERDFAALVGSKEAVAVSSGTAALHSAMHAIGIKPGDEVIVSPITFAATVNCIVYQGGTPVFADVEEDTLLLNPEKAIKKVSDRTKAIISMDYGGRPCDYDALQKVADQFDLILVADACHSLGARYKKRDVGTLADLTTFSFHPVKHITTGEGGMITTESKAWADRIKKFRNHCIQKDFRQRAEQNTWKYEIHELGFNYRLTDIQCALGRSQLKKLPRWINRRREIARQYDEAFSEISSLKLLTGPSNVIHAYHLYVIRLILDRISCDRSVIYQELRNEGIGVNVHYIPVYLHPYYRKRFGIGPGLCPVAESVYEEILSLPIFPSMSADDVEKVIQTVRNIMGKYSV